MRKNRNRGYQKLRVWNDAIDYTEDDFQTLENGLLKLVESLEQKRERGEWIDHLMVKESNTVCGIE